MAKPAEKTERQVRMGIGEAVLRLVHVELKFANGLSEVPQHLRDERDLIVQALDHYQLDLGFDCDGDGAVDIAEDVNIFKQSAETSCCRILPKDTSRKGSGKTPKGVEKAPVGVKAPAPPVVTPSPPVEPVVGGAFDAPDPQIMPTPSPAPVPPVLVPLPPVTPEIPKAARGDLSRRKR